MSEANMNLQAMSVAVLDYEYLKILRIMKPYITCIMNNHYIELIRLWLEKLSDPTFTDKVQRNVYLVQLGRQVEDGNFTEPFINAPPEGHLKPYQEQWKENIITIQEETVPSTQANEPEDKVLWQYFPFTKSSITYTAWDENISQQQQNQSPTSKYFHQEHSPLENDLAALETSIAPKLERNRSEKFEEMKEKLDQFEETMSNIVLKTRTKNLGKTLTGITGNGNNFVANNQELLRLDLSGAATTPFVKRDDESSWCDLSEISTNLGSGDGQITPRLLQAKMQNDSKHLEVVYESKIEELLRIIHELRRENSTLIYQVDKFEKDQISHTNTAETSIHNLVGEVECLKNRLQELVDVKSALQSSHYNAHSDWQNSITNLNKKLRNVQRKNNDLKALVAILEAQLKEERYKAQQVSINTNKKDTVSEMCIMETNMLKQIHEKTIKDLEEKLTEAEEKLCTVSAKFREDLEKNKQCFDNELATIKNERFEVQRNCDSQMRDLKNNCDEKISAIRGNYERNIAEMKSEFRKDLDFKDSEIERLEVLVQEQCGRMHEEVQLIRLQLEHASQTESEESYLQKIAFLQKCIMKMEKLYLKSERDYVKQINKLRKDIELRDKQNQIALCTQRAGIITDKTIGKQSEIDVIILKLEDYYKGVIIKQQEQMVDERKRDALLIEDLRNQIVHLNTSSSSNIPERF